MTTLAQTPHRAATRGGNRLPAGHAHPGPRYARRSDFDADHERRDLNQRERTRRAVGLALKHGQLTPLLAAVLGQLLDASNNRLIDAAPDGGPACTGWWSLRHIHTLVAPRLAADGVPVPADELDPNEGARSAGRWMHQLFELGWVDKIHRRRIVNGVPTGTSNLWRIQIPDAYRNGLHAREDARRADKTREAHRNGRYTAPRSAAEATAEASTARHAAEERRRAQPCPVCDGDKLVEQTDGAYARCAACNGTGTRAGP